MVLNYIWIAFFITAFVIAAVRLLFFGDTEVFPEIINSTFSSSKTAFEISLGLTGVLSLWLGIMRVGERGGVIDALSRVLSPVFTRLFPDIPKGHPATGSIFMNLAANMLGLDNAATPLGLKAMEQMQELNTKKDTATNPMIMFLVLNTSGLTLIPVSIMVYRAQLGAANPTDVFVPLLLATFFSTITGVIVTSLYHERTAKAIGKQAGVDEVIAGVLPDGKEAVIRQLQSRGKVAMVGDGINDAPALTRADIGIAIGAGADVAVDAADVVLMKSRLLDVSAAIRLSRATLRNIHENLFWAFAYNVCGIPLAAGVFISLLGWKLNPMFGAAAMSLSSFCVVSNALRLNLFDIRNAAKDKSIKHKRKEQKTMTKTLKIEGMMCPHCEATVKKALEAIDGVTEATADHNTDTAVVTLSKDVSNDVLRKAVEDKDYPVKDIQ